MDLPDATIYKTRFTLITSGKLCCAMLCCAVGPQLQASVCSLTSLPLCCVLWGISYVTAFGPIVFVYQLPPLPCCSSQLFFKVKLQAWTCMLLAVVKGPAL